MGRGRLKAKQQKIARKLKYLTTDTDYDELAKELGVQESSSAPAQLQDSVHANRQQVASVSESISASDVDDDLDDYAKWAAEAASKAISGEFPAVSSASSGSINSQSSQARPMPRSMPMPRKPIPMPVPSALKPKKK